MQELGFPKVFVVPLNKWIQRCPVSQTKDRASTGRLREGDDVILKVLQFRSL